jgi:hypothetical protein
MYERRIWLMYYSPHRERGAVGIQLIQSHALNMLKVGKTLKAFKVLSPGKS